MCILSFVLNRVIKLRVLSQTGSVFKDFVALNRDPNIGQVPPPPPPPPPVERKIRESPINTGLAVYG